MSSDSLLGILGIAVSVVLFLIGYRQTVGAKKERVAAADSEIEKILVRRIVLEGYVLKTADIERLAEGKARDNMEQTTIYINKEPGSDYFETEWNSKESA